MNEKINWDDVFDNNISIDSFGSQSPVKIDCFSLSDNDKKNGNYLSLLNSNGSDPIDRIRKCFSWYKEKRSGFPLYFGFCEIDRESAISEINDEYNIIKFEKKGSLTLQGVIHYGMFYLSSDESDILEAKNTLVLLSKFFPCKKYTSSKVIGELSNINTIENFYVLE